MQIKVLGPGCRNCSALEENTRQALASLDRTDAITKVTDFAEIAGYGVLTTPALVIDDTVVLAGRVPDTAELRGILVSAGSS
jgi:small redox-active disulfide protein 2